MSGGATGDVQVTLGQTDWWKGRDGRIILVDDMPADYRRNVANWLLDRAAAMHLRLVRSRMMFPPLGGRYGDGGPDPEWEFPTGKQILDTARRLQDQGAHIDLVVKSPLYRRLVGAE